MHTEIKHLQPTKKLHDQVNKKNVSDTQTYISFEKLNDYLEKCSQFLIDEAELNVHTYLGPKLRTSI